MTLLQLLKQQKKALVLLGPRCCGKTLLTNELARGVITHVHISELLKKPYASQDWLKEKPDVVIVEGTPKRHYIEVLEQLVTSVKLKRNLLRKTPDMINTPMFIFHTNDFRSTNKAFYVLKMGTLEIS
jgi:hypothetical protein